jgi:hypothetical protein
VRSRGVAAGADMSTLQEVDAVTGEATAFVDKHRARWPEWEIAAVYLPAPQRPLAAAWLALLQELGDAAWGGADPTPGQAKLAWWQEELRGWAAGRRRHPLGQVLLRETIPWAALAAGLPTLAGSRERPADSTGALSLLGPFAVAAAEVEAALLGVESMAASSGDLASAMLSDRLLHHRDRAVPLQLQAQFGQDAAAAWANALLASWPRGTPVARARRLQAMLQRARLRQLASGAAAPLPLSRWATLWRGWRAARSDGSRD